MPLLAVRLIHRCGQAVLRWQTDDPSLTCYIISTFRVPGINNDMGYRLELLGTMEITEEMLVI